MMHDARRAIVVDPGDAGPVLAACQAQELELAGILVTHHHADHVGGIDALRAQVRASGPVPVWGPAGENIPGRDHPLRGGERFAPAGFPLDVAVLAVPGHTLGHLAYHVVDRDTAVSRVFCGDTLFSAGCGRLFEGTPQQMLSSLDHLAELPADTEVCCAHEYTLGNLQFARHVEPDNADAARYQDWCAARVAAGLGTLPSSIAQELRVNPFLRVDQPEVRARLSERAGRPLRDRVDAFALLRQWKDEF